MVHYTESKREGTKRIIKCIECGAERVIYTQNYRSVKRCLACQYLMRRGYNSEYVKQKRKVAKVALESRKRKKNGKEKVGKALKSKI